MASKKTTQNEVKTPVKKAAVKKDVAKKTDVQGTAPIAQKKTSGSLTVDVFDMTGNVVETLVLPQEVFGVKVNKVLLAQAVRVYLANQRSGTASTKTRGEVAGSTRKIYRQKGTGRARHGGVRAPIFVKGGIAFGPKPRDFGMKLPQKMRTVALYAALSAKLREGEVKVLAGMADIEPKTKAMAKALQAVATESKKQRMLIITNGDIANVSRATRNLPGVMFTAANRLNPYEVLTNRTIVLMKEAVDVLVKRAQ